MLHSGNLGVPQDLPDVASALMRALCHLANNIHHLPEVTRVHMNVRVAHINSVCVSCC